MSVENAVKFEDDQLVITNRTITLKVGGRAQRTYNIKSIVSVKHDETHWDSWEKRVWRDFKQCWLLYLGPLVLGLFLDNVFKKDRLFFNLAAGLYFLLFFGSMFTRDGIEHVFTIEFSTEKVPIASYYVDARDEAKVKDLRARSQLLLGVIRACIEDANQ